MKIKKSLLVNVNQLKKLMNKVIIRMEK